MVAGTAVFPGTAGEGVHIGGQSCAVKSDGKSAGRIGYVQLVVLVEGAAVGGDYVVEFSLC